MANKYVVVQTDVLKKIAGCFSSEEEYTEFAHSMQSLVRDLEFDNQIIDRNIENETVVDVTVLKQIFMFGAFCRENMDVISEIVRFVDFKEITKEERDRIWKGGDG